LGNDVAKYSWKGDINQSSPCCITDLSICNNHGTNKCSQIDGINPKKFLTAGWEAGKKISAWSGGNK